MAVTQATRNPSSNLAHAVVIVAIALGLVISAFTVGAVASFSGADGLSRQLLPQPAWRTVWGSGANVTQSTHGCVNTPTAAMARLYSWAEVGTTVLIQ